MNRRNLFALLAGAIAAPRALMAMLALTAQARKPFWSFTPATWHGTTRCNAAGSLGVSFDMPDGSVVRLLLDRQSATHVAETLREYLDGWAARRE